MDIFFFVFVDTKRKRIMKSFVWIEFFSKRRWRKTKKKYIQKCKNWFFVKDPIINSFYQSTNLSKKKGNVFVYFHPWTVFHYPVDLFNSHLQFMRKCRRWQIFIFIIIKNYNISVNSHSVICSNLRIFTWISSCVWIIITNFSGVHEFDRIEILQFHWRSN